tara:strand:+ start:620 stop:781 length:162 start_codon:yes stop_codon:yes gene_type:complete
MRTDDVIDHFSLVREELNVHALLVLLAGGDEQCTVVAVVPKLTALNGLMPEPM